MSVQLDMAARTALAALNNLIQLAQEEGEDVDLYLDYSYDDEGNKHFGISGSDWRSSSMSC